ncbi:PKD domain-containing protein [Methanococcoides methylutens]|uniref:PKD domain-containing protein n=1 Tax=Methanococcoides methylutens TaxID=2226 RepID=UPI0040444DA4
MHPIIKPLGLLLFITLLMSGLTSISTNSPGLAPNPTDDSHESTYSEWEDAIISKDRGILMSRSSGMGGNSGGDSGDVDAGDSGEGTLPIANFTATPLSGIAPLTVTFTDLSSNVTLLSWDIDGIDGEDSNASEFDHVYDKVGLYNVSLTVSNENGSDTKTVVNYINVTGSNDNSGDGEGTLPIANFTATPLSGVAPLTVTFTDLSSNVTLLSWDVDGIDGEDSNASEFDHVYDKVGLYNVSLTVSNENGSDTKTVVNYINVTGSNDNSGDGEGTLPIANFTATPLSGVAPLTVTFTDLSSNVTLLSWDVDGIDGEDSNASEFDHVYDKVGLYNVSLTVSNENGSDTKTVVNYINVTGSNDNSGDGEGTLPIANFTATPLSGVAPLTVTFTDLSSNVTLLSWDVDGIDGEDSNASEFDHVYDKVGLYNVSLTVSNENGSDTKTVVNYINVTGSNDDPGDVYDVYDGLISWWRFDEISGSNAIDSIGDNHGDISGATRVIGVNGTALSFNGSGDYVSVPHNITLDLTNNFSILFWMNVSDVEGRYQILDKGKNKIDNFGVYLENDMVYFEWNNNGHNNVSSNELDLSANEWYQITIVVNETHVQFYKDDVGAGSELINVGLLTYDYDFFIGQKGQGYAYKSENSDGNDKNNVNKNIYYFNGLLDEIKIYNRVLSQSEVEQYYESTKP